MMAAMALRAMTWNLWWRFGEYARRQRAIVDTIRSVDPDVVCLQEVWSTADEDQVAILAGELAMHAVRTDPVLYDGHSFGNAVLSRWPIERIDSVTLPSSTGAPSHRSVIGGVVLSPAGPWPVASAHLDHRFDASATRVAQARRLLELATMWRGDPDRDPPLLLGVDVNAVPDSDEVRMLTGRASGVDGVVFSDAWEQCGDGVGETWRSANPLTAGSAWPDRRIDYLFVSWPRPKPVGNPIRTWTAGTAPVDVDGAAIWPSDHAAVVADITTVADVTTRS